MEEIQIYTIGFTKKTAEYFFESLKKAGVKRIIDVRLNNTSQLAGFTKRDDLTYFLKEICQIEYLHLPELAPTQAILDAYKKEKGDWKVYEAHFLQLLQDRRIEDTLSPEIVDRGCLLCSEGKPERCHRRLVAEYLKERWGNIRIEHLV
ncbi:hypothetical protein U27_06896 [Candidatus Vecturithrix granuli]|uniref:DUF488 domain-containing protein n=1 Tax=Vecturithrix granuli TaxID=1499967 RepID=A0A081C5Q5_VECG1|nr:hypothetical protein U27_06896 [Candidatus Vecturithrix granuli]